MHVLYRCMDPMTEQLHPAAVLRIMENEAASEGGEQNGVDLQEEAHGI